MLTVWDCAMPASTPARISLFGVSYLALSAGAIALTVAAAAPMRSRAYTTNQEVVSTPPGEGVPGASAGDALFVSTRSTQPEALSEAQAVQLSLYRRDREAAAIALVRVRSDLARRGKVVRLDLPSAGDVLLGRTRVEERVVDEFSRCTKSGSRGMGQTAYSCRATSDMSSTLVDLTRSPKARPAAAGQLRPPLLGRGRHGTARDVGRAEPPRSDPANAESWSNCRLQGHRRFDRPRHADLPPGRLDPDRNARTPPAC